MGSPDEQTLAGGHACRTRGGARAGSARPGLAEPGFFTHHFRHGDFRQDNYGPGVEIALAPPHGLLAGSFINSDRERSRYLAYSWRPWRMQAGGVDLAAGIVVGAIDGYSSTNAGDWFPALAPAFSAQYGFVGANVVFIPHPKNGVLLALQLKLRVW